MNHTKQLMKTSRGVLLLAAAVLLAGAGGCGAQRPLAIQPVNNKQAVIQPKFNNVTYRQDMDGALYFVGRSSTFDKTLNENVDQVLTVRVFWIPKGGVTSLNKTSLNATYRYIVMTPSAVGMYEGAGFVRFGGKVGKPKLTVRLMDGDLRLSEASTSFVDNLGRSNMKGQFTARMNEAATVEMWLQAHRDFFYRSMNLKPPEKREGVELQATTQPWVPPEPLGSGTQPTTQRGEAETQRKPEEERVTTQPGTTLPGVMPSTEPATGASVPKPPVE